MPLDPSDIGVAARDRRLHTGSDGTLLRALRTELASCRRAQLAVAFVMSSGVDLLDADIRRALLRGASIYLLTTDYLDVTEPDALRRLLALGEGCEIRVFVAGSRSFHPKAYLFEREDGSGRAFIGSANLSRSGLDGGVEWTWAVLDSDSGNPMSELSLRFTELFMGPDTIPLSAAWIDDYERRRVPKAETHAESARYEIHAPKPRPVQVLALEELRRLRDDGERRALVIAATGLGKTYLAAFDSRGFDRVLFVAHREELLNQAADAFAAVRREDSFGFLVSGRRELDRRMVFASVQSLGSVLADDPDALAGFDYVVIDEFHHAAAPTYLAVIARLRPTFLLGLTATPYRGDNRDLFALCDGNVAYEIGLFAAIGYGWLAPFRYFGIADVASYGDELLNVSRTGYDAAKLTTLFNTGERAHLAIRNFRDHLSRAALGFCVSIAHAEYMADEFAKAGIPALAVHSGPGSAGRAEAISRLVRGEVRILFVVDLFNEGVDIPCVDLVMFLRPTESMTVFLQQLGRGLRTHRGKRFLTVLDFIGNYRRAHFKLPFLVGLEDVSEEAAKRASAQLESGLQASTLPDGVKVTLDPVALDHLREAITRNGTRRVQLQQEFEALRDELGRRPTLLEVERRSRHSARQFCRAFGSWFGVLQACGAITPSEAALEAECGEFLRELERTSMTRTYKMVVLEAMLRDGSLRPVVPLADIREHFRSHFRQARHRHELDGTPVAGISEVDSSMLERYILDNPINAWIGGNRGEPSPYFQWSEADRTFAYIGPQASDSSEFAAAVAERAAWRIEAHLARPGPDQAAYKVIPAGRGSHAIIMLGDENGDGLPRSKGWQVVRVNARLMYAKFAKIAINTLAESPDGENVLTAELEKMFGPELLRFERPRRVMIIRDADSGVLEILPLTGSPGA
jgi:superfamily II DNA or RNA helicase/HKD family nuclease